MTPPQGPRRRRRSGRLLLSILVAAVSGSAGCRRSPQVAFARLLDQTASWAASVDFTQDLQRQGLVPAAFLNDVVEHGATEVQDLQHQLASTDEIPADLRSQAAVLSGRLAILLSDSSRSRLGTNSQSTRSQVGVDSESTRQLRAIEMRLRALAQQVRGGAADAQP